MQFAGMNRAECLEYGGTKWITYFCVCPNERGAKRMTQLKDGQPGNREERSLSASTVIARWQGNGEPCKSRGLRTVLWAAGGEIPPADPAAWNPDSLRRSARVVYGRSPVDADSTGC